MEKFVRTAAVPGVSLADILTDPRTLIKDIEKANAHPSRSSKTPTKLKDMLKKKSSILYNKVCITRLLCLTGLQSNYINCGNIFPKYFCVTYLQKLCISFDL